MKIKTYNCKICNTEHEDPSDAIDCTMACLLPTIKEAYKEDKTIKLTVELRKIVALEDIAKYLEYITIEGIGVKR